MLKGIAASGGIGTGQVFVLKEPDLRYDHVVPAGTEKEKERFRDACNHIKFQTTLQAAKLEQEAGKEQAEILRGQLMFLEDPSLTAQVEDMLDAGACAEAAVDTVLAMFREMFASLDDELMRQRAADLEDLRTRLLKGLLGLPEDAGLSFPMMKSVVLAARELTPSMTAGLRRGSIGGIVTELGGYTSHASILARSLEIPAVVGVTGLLDQLKPGDRVILDGDRGDVLINPGQDTWDSYQALQEMQAFSRMALQHYAGRPTVTADGRKAALYCNIGSPGEAELVMEATGEGVGLFRTEFLFMDRNRLPTEEEQYLAYRQAAETVQGREVIIRTLDVGGDKDIPYLGLEKEENPFLGHRAIRFCLDRRDVFVPQLRALLRASAHGDIKIMLPLVTCVEELREAKALIREQMEKLDAEGVPYNKQLKVGVMIETPAAVWMADALAKEADFFSIGTNDLTQYTMAADRGNQKVAALGSPMQPAVLRAIRQVIEAGHRENIPVGMCGEAAADPALVPLWLAFGLDEFSVSPSAVLATRKAIHQWTTADAQALAQSALSLDTKGQIAALLGE